MKTEIMKMILLMKTRPTCIWGSQSGTYLGLMGFQCLFQSSGKSVLWVAKLEGCLVRFFNYIYIHFPHGTAGGYHKFLTLQIYIKKSLCVSTIYDGLKMWMTGQEAH